MVKTFDKRATGVFSSHQKLEEALNEAKTSGFPMNRVSVIAKQANPDAQLEDAKMSDHIGDKNVGSATGVVADALTESTWGTILIGLTSLSLPGIGPIIAAGSLGAALVTTLAGVGIGTVNANGLVKALAALGIPEERAREYGDHLLQGNYLVIVDGSEEEINSIEAILTQGGIQDWGIYSSPKN